MHDCYFGRHGTPGTPTVVRLMGKWEYLADQSAWESTTVLPSASVSLSSANGRKSVGVGSLVRAFPGRYELWKCLVLDSLLAGVRATPMDGLPVQGWLESGTYWPSLACPVLFPFGMRCPTQCKSTWRRARCLESNTATLLAVLMKPSPPHKKFSPDLLVVAPLRDEMDGNLRVCRLCVHKQ